MSVITKCTTCSRELRAKDEYAGYRTRCPDCGTINLLPDQPGSSGQDGEPAVGEAPGGECPLCGQDFYANRDWVKDTKGRYFHRCCYEAAQLRQKNRRGPAAQTRNAPPSQHKGKPRTSPSARSKSNRVPPNPSDTSAQPSSKPSSAAVPPPSNAPPADDFWGELGAPLDSTDTLWNNEMLAAGEALSGVGGTGLAAGTVLAPVSARSKLDRNIKVWIGVGAAVPVLLILAIVISIFTRPEPPAQSVAESSPVVERLAPNPNLEQADIPPHSLPVLPPAHPDPFPSAKPARNATTAEKVTDVIGYAIGIFIVSFVVYTLIAAATLQAACNLCQIASPSFGKALLITLAAYVVGFFIMFVFVVMPTNDVGQLVSAMLITLAMAVAGIGFTYSKLLPTTFGKGVLIYIVQAILMFAIGITINVILSRFTHMF